MSLRTVGEIAVLDTFPLLWGCDVTPSPADHGIDLSSRILCSRGVGARLGRFHPRVSQPDEW